MSSYTIHPEHYYARISRLLLLCLLPVLLLMMPDTLAAQKTGPSTEGKASLSVIGGLSGSNVYLAYLSLEAIAANFSCGNYSADEAVKVCSSVSNLIEKTILNLRSAQNLEGISREDHVFLDEMIGAYGILRGQALYLLDYTASLSDDDLSLFMSAKQDSWEAIQELLGLGPDSVFGK